MYIVHGKAAISHEDPPSLSLPPTSCPSLLPTPQEVCPPPPIDVPPRTPVSLEQWQSFMRPDGSLADPATVRGLIFSNVCFCSAAHLNRDSQVFLPCVCLLERCHLFVPFLADSLLSC